MNDDPDLRARLERIASVAGDPPEHGLERVTARRHRRLRRRRGAVATAAVLAVLAVGAPLISEIRDDRQSVTASETASPAGAPAEVPRLVEVHCATTGIVVPVASVRPERDGLHIRVHNSQPVATSVEVDGDDWSSGPIDVAPGVHDVRQPVPPGQLTIGCEIAGSIERRRVDLVDPAGHYRTPALACADADQVTLRDLPVDPASRSIVAAARTGLDAYLLGGTSDDAVGARRGYPAQRLSDATDDPVVQLVRDGEVVAFAHVRGAGGSTAAPWTAVDEVEVCRSALDPAVSVEAPTGTTTSTTATTRPPGDGPPQ